jgi:hypothetical protein
MKPTTRKIILRELTLTKRFKFMDFIRRQEFPEVVGGDHNTVLLQFKDMEHANYFMEILYKSLKKVRGVFTEFDESGNLRLRIKTKMDVYL